MLICLIIKILVAFMAGRHIFYKKFSVKNLKFFREQDKTALSSLKYNIEKMAYGTVRVLVFSKYHLTVGV